MTLALRRLAAAGMLAACSVFGVSMGEAVAAPSASPSVSASPSASTGSGDEDISVSEDTAPDNSRMIWIIGGATAVAIIAGAVVIARP